MGWRPYAVLPKLGLVIVRELRPERCCFAAMLLAIENKTCHGFGQALVSLPVIKAI
jgi:hypothetical protein